MHERLSASLVATHPFSLPWPFVPEQDSVPRGVIDMARCLSIKGAEDLINKPYAFEIATQYDSMYYLADNDKARAVLLSIAVWLHLEAIWDLL